ETGQSWTFAEIDPAVTRVAEEEFSYLRDCRQQNKVQIDVGDARTVVSSYTIWWGGEEPPKFDVLFADAFSSDAVPVHLLTKEALDLYKSCLSWDGVMIFNVTNRYLDLEPVLGDLAADAGLVCIARGQGV